jgi:hypothetical protein
MSPMAVGHVDDDDDDVKNCEICMFSILKSLVLLGTTILFWV